MGIISPPVVPPKPPLYRVIDIITNAFIEAGWLAPGEFVEPENAGFAFSKLNDIYDEWAALHAYVWSEQFQQFTLVPNLSPHTIGPEPNATFSVPQRPVRLESSAVRLVNGQNTTTDVPMAIRDADWWANERIKDLQSTFPTNVYYEPDWPNGSLFFWPVPTTNYPVLLEWWNSVQQFNSLTEQFTCPPAYRRAITLTLAEELGGPRSNDLKLTTAAANARASVRGNNAPSPRIDTGSGGMPKPSTRPRFNFLTGQPW